MHWPRAARIIRITDTGAEREEAATNYFTLLTVARSSDVDASRCANKHPKLDCFCVHIGGRPGPRWGWYAEAKSTCAYWLVAAASLANCVGLVQHAQLGHGFSRYEGLGMIGIQSVCACVRPLTYVRAL